MRAHTNKKPRGESCYGSIMLLLVLLFSFVSFFFCSIRIWIQTLTLSVYFICRNVVRCCDNLFAFGIHWTDSDRTLSVYICIICNVVKTVATTSKKLSTVHSGDDLNTINKIKEMSARTRTNRFIKPIKRMQWIKLMQF